MWLYTDVIYDLSENLKFVANYLRSELSENLKFCDNGGMYYVIQFLAFLWSELSIVVCHCKHYSHSSKLDLAVPIILQRRTSRLHVVEWEEGFCAVLDN